MYPMDILYYQSLRCIAQKGLFFKTLLRLFIVVTHTSPFFSAHYVCYRLDTLIYTRTEDHVLSTSTWRFWRIINKPSLLWCFCLKKIECEVIAYLNIAIFLRGPEEVLSAFFCHWD